MVAQVVVVQVVVLVVALARALTSCSCHMPHHHLVHIPARSTTTIHRTPAPIHATAAVLGHGLYLLA